MNCIIASKLIISMGFLYLRKEREKKKKETEGNDSFIHLEVKHLLLSLGER